MAQWQEEVCVCVCACVCVCTAVCIVSFRGPAFFVVVFVVGRHSCRSFTEIRRPTAAFFLVSPGTPVTFSDIAAPGPDVLLARRGSGSELLSVTRVTEQADVPISGRCGNLVVPLTS